ncbi:MAG: 4Fe-4S dicluster domain-containing protein, partial [Pseudohongiellaceae bacterium]
RYLQLAAGSVVAGLLPSCRPAPQEQIVPYVNMPEYRVPGEPVYYSTALSVGGFAVGVLAEVHTGRPVKIEGNPLHPASLGASDIFSQAALVNLYDPTRARTVTRPREQAAGVGTTVRADSGATWGSFQAHVLSEREQWLESDGEGLHLLTTTISSPTLLSRIDALQRRFPRLRWHEYEPVNRDNAREGNRLAFGTALDTVCHFDRAGVVLSLDADFLEATPASLRYAHDFSLRRDPGSASMNRLYVIESRATPTGIRADHRLPVKAAHVEHYARHLGSLFNLDTGDSQADIPSAHLAWLEALADDLRANRGNSLVIAGAEQPAAVHGVAQALNAQLGNIDVTVSCHQPLGREDGQMQSLRELVASMQEGEVQSLYIIDGDPAYDTPADLEFAQLLAQVPDTTHWSLYRNTTSSLCRWHIPATHEFETWGDTRAFEGTVSIQQPLIMPLSGGYSAFALLALLNGDLRGDAYTTVQGYWREQTGLPEDAFQEFWRTALQRGVIGETAADPVNVELQQLPAGEDAAPATFEPGTLEIRMYPDPRIFDGRFSGNSWLQELPKPLTSLTWDNALQVHPETAERLQLVTEDLVELDVAGRRTKAVVYVLPDQPIDSLALSLGYGSDGGYGNAYKLQSAASPWFTPLSGLRRTGERYPLATTQQHYEMDVQQPVKHSDLQTFIDNPQSLDSTVDHPSLYPEPRPAMPETKSPYAWGMAIDLNDCIGCNACTIACQAENNIPVVGKDEVLRGREMYWIRVDYYHAPTSASAPAGFFQPVPCMHCENAPCEYVCPVAATLHDSEGLNAMVYNRCIGTRDCSQNCPYKVRRFNWLDYNYGAELNRAMIPLRNPDVSVRSRGVMEKCTYCVQRISAARREAKKENRLIRDGEVQTACQAACPTNAIVFGNLDDADSEVSREKAGVLDYHLLAELNTRPRTSYKTYIANPNPRLQNRDS